MREDTLIKIVAMVCVTALWVVNAFAFKLDASLMALTVSVVAGIAGYSIGKTLSKYPSDEELRTLCKMVEEEK